MNSLVLVALVLVVLAPTFTHRLAPIPALTPTPQLRQLVETPAAERSWFLAHPGKEVVYDATELLLLYIGDFSHFKPIPIIHPSYMRFCKFGPCTPFLVQVSIMPIIPT